MKIRLIKNDKEYVRMLKAYFVLLVKSHETEFEFIKCSRKFSDFLQIKKLWIKKYYKLGVLHRQMYVLQNSLSYYVANKDKTVTEIFHASGRSAGLFFEKCAV